MQKNRIAFLLLSSVVLLSPISGKKSLTPLEARREIDVISQRRELFQTITEEGIRQKKEIEECDFRASRGDCGHEHEIVEEEIVEEVQLEPHYNPYNLRELSNLTEEQIYNMLEGNPLQTLSRAYYYYEQEFQVNVFFIIALNREESGNGQSDLAMSHNNLGGVKDFETGGWKHFSDWGESLRYIMNLMNEHYLTPDGEYYNGVDIWSINQKYCEGTQWAINLNNIAYEMLNKVE